MLSASTTATPAATGSQPTLEPCLLVILGASGDLTSRLLIPAIGNLAREKRLPERFAIIGSALEPLEDAAFAAKMTAAIQSFKTVETFDPAVWARLPFHYVRFAADDPTTFQQLASTVDELGRRYGTGGNVLFYLALSPTLFAKVAEQLAASGLAKSAGGWRRLIVEKPFGRDLASALALNHDLRRHWSEDQIYRIDHYLGKETVQNLLAFRFANALYEPVWNHRHIDHIQITAAESVGVEERASYYDRSGALRDMIQNHLLQVLTYVTMEPPASCRAEDIRDAKTKLLESVRVFGPGDAAKNCVRGQYGPGRKDGAAAAGYRQEPGVDPQSNTETYVALRLAIDNDRWRGVPIYLRTGKRLWKRGAEIVVQMKKQLAQIFQSTPAEAQLDSNLLLFHLQPAQAIEYRFQAKTPGTALALQRVNMRFDYRDAFAGGRGTGYEILLHGAMTGDRTLFSRSDLVEASWRIVQPILDAWQTPATEFPNYAAGTWGPKAASDLLTADGWYWIEVIHADMLASVPLFASISEKVRTIFLNKVAMILEPVQAAAGETIATKGEMGDAMYFIVRGDVAVDDGAGRVLGELREGSYFGELSLLFATPRTANVKAVTSCDLLALRKTDFDILLGEHPELAAQLHQAAQKYPRQ